MGEEEQFELGQAGAQLGASGDPGSPRWPWRGEGRPGAWREAGTCPKPAGAHASPPGFTVATVLAPGGGEEGRRGEEQQHPRPQECGGTRFPELGETRSFCLGRLGAGPRTSWGSLEPECSQPLAILRVSLKMKGPALPLLWYLLRRLRFFVDLFALL